MGIWESRRKNGSYNWERSWESVGEVGERDPYVFSPALSVSPKVSPIAKCFIILNSLSSTTKHTPLRLEMKRAKLQGRPLEL